MSKKKPRGKHGQRKGDTHYSPPKPLVVLPPHDPPKPPSDTRSAAPEEESDTQELTEAVDRHVRMNTWFAGAIMVATVVQAIVNGFQWSAMNRSLGQTDIIIEQMRLEQRPWITAGNPILNSPLTAGKPLDFTVRLHNSGQTPAIAMCGGYGLYAGNESGLGAQVAAVWKNARENRMEVAIGPGSVFSMQRSDDFEMPPNTVTEIERGTRQFFLIGGCEYRGANEGQYGVEYCFVYIPSSRDFVLHPKYNRIFTKAE